MRVRIGVMVLLIAVLAVGCKKGPPEITILTGRVTIDGKPVTSGLVNVISEDSVVSASAEIAADGSYSIVGAPVGPVKFSVNTEDYREILPEPGSGTTKSRPNSHYVATPKKYEKFETSGLIATVSKGKAEHDIALTSN